MFQVWGLMFGVWGEAPAETQTDFGSIAGNKTGT